MIPLISSICHGPLEICHLPRFWWKTLTRKAGILDEEYPDLGHGLDARVLDILKLDHERTLSYLRTTMPTYLDFETWVLEQVTLDRAVTDKWNESVCTRMHTNPEKLAETTGDIGIPNDGEITSAVLLNSLQDWSLFFKRDLSTNFSGLGGSVVPLIATIDYGPLEVCQLPRTWLKVLLKARNLLHPDYPDCGGGLDARVLNVLKLDRDKTVAFLRNTTPQYLEFEAWVLQENGGQLDRAAIHEWNTFLRNREHTAEKRADIHKTLGSTDNGSLTSAVVLNQIEDWHLAHTDLIRTLHG
ncbi:MAG: hypothetical protein O2954_09055 [bacterium]|nr:hypothetical protein [bacterium]